MKKIFKYILGIILAAAVIGAIVFAFNAMSKKASLTSSGKLAVVDLQKLVSAHRDYGKLMQLNEKIVILQEKINEAPDELKNINIAMRKEQELAAAGLGDELVKIKKKLSTEQEQLKNEFKKEQEDMMRQMKSVQNEEEDVHAPRMVTSKTLKQNLDQFAKDLMILKEKQVAAKRLELQKKLSESLRNLEESNEKELAAFEQQIWKKNQNEKINLKLKYENAATSEEREQVKQKMMQLEEEESKARDAKKAVLSARYDDVKRRGVQEIEKEITAYDAKLQKDVMAQIQGKNAYEKTKPQDVLTSPQYAAMKKKANDMQARYEQKTKELSKKYEKEFEAKKKELEEKLKSHEKQLLAKALKNEDEIVKLSEDKRKEIEKQIETLTEQRNRLYEQIMNDIRERAGEIVKDENVQYVFGSYIYNVDCEDLTEKMLK